jgi:uncharacterized protein with PhoU and TrkA domain
VSPNSALIGHTARQLRFRTYYNAAVLAIHRQARAATRPPCDAMRCDVQLEMR